MAKKNFYDDGHIDIDERGLTDADIDNIIVRTIMEQDNVSREEAEKIYAESLELEETPEFLELYESLRDETIWF